MDNKIDPIVTVHRILTYRGQKSKVEAHMARRFLVNEVRGLDPGSITERFEGDEFYAPLSYASIPVGSSDAYRLAVNHMRKIDFRFLAERTRY